MNTLVSCVIRASVIRPPPERRAEGKADGLIRFRNNPAGWKPAGKSRELQHYRYCPRSVAEGAAFAGIGPPGLKDGAGFTEGQAADEISGRPARDGSCGRR